MTKEEFAAAVERITNHKTYEELQVENERLRASLASMRTALKEIECSGSLAQARKIARALSQTKGADDA